MASSFNSLNSSLLTEGAAPSDQGWANVTTLMLNDGSVLNDLACVRAVPAKRYVYRAFWHGQAVYAKLFTGKNNGYYAHRDIAGVQRLVQAKIKTPPLLFQGLTQDGQNSVLVFEAIEHAGNVDEVWFDCDAAQRYSLAQKLVETLAHHHQAGLIQTDLYFKNFLLQGDLVYTLDGDGIRQLSRLFAKRQRTKNLATLFSKMDVLDDAWIPQLYAQYCRQLNIVHKVADALAVHMQTQSIRRKMANAYADKKVFRTCSDVKVRQGFNYFVAVSSGFELPADVFTALDAALADRHRNLKNGNTCTVASAVIAGRQVVVKRYNIKHVWHALERAFRVSRAADSWANAHRLLISNIATPQPLALVEARLGKLRRRAYFLSEYLNAPDVMEFFSQTGSAEVKASVASSLAELLHRLYLFRFSHGDLKASNIKIVDHKPVLIDLDSMRAHSLYRFAGWWFESRHVSDLNRFMQNWAHDAEMTGMLQRALRQQYASGDANAAERILRKLL